MKKILLLLALLASTFSLAQTTTQYTAGSVVVTCNAVAATGDCTTGQFDLATFGGATPAITWVVTTTGSPTGVTVWFEGSLDGTSWGKLAIITQTDTEWGTTITAGEMAHITNKPVRFVRGSVQTLSGGATPSVTVRFMATH